MLCGSGLPGLQKKGGTVDAESKPTPLLGFFNPEVRPAKCLYLPDGEPRNRVADALQANAASKTTSIVMLFERRLAENARP